MTPTPRRRVRCAAALLTGALALAGCGTSVDIDAVTSSADTPTVDAVATPSATDTPAPVDPTATTAPEPEPTATPEPEPTATEEPLEEPTATAEPTSEPAEVPDGFQQVDLPGNYSFVAPEDWSVLTDAEDVEELLELGFEVTGLDTAQVPLLIAQLEADGSVVLLDTSGDNMNVLAVPGFNPLLQDPDGYKDLVESQFSSAAGFSDVSLTASVETYAGREGLFLVGSYALDGQPLYLTQFTVEGSGSTYIFSITLTSDDTDLVKTILASIVLA